MMSLAQVRELSREAAAKAAKQHKEPFMLWKEDLEDWKAGNFKGFPFPFLGDYLPKGWKRVTSGEDEQPVTYFVDSSGMGADDEPALSLRRFLDVLEPGYGYAVTEAGQFQVYVGKYQRRRKEVFDK